MSKSKENNINKLGERLIKNIDLYDGPVVVDNGEIKFEKEVGATDLYKPKRKVQTWDIMKDAAKEKAKKGDYKELRELRKIEKKMNYESKPFKKKPIETRTESSKDKSDTTPAPDIPNFLKFREAAPVDNTLNKILEDRNKPDPDYFKGLGTFLTKKI